ncbi:stage II sporulation protein M [Gryllotalpicola ginsengisoli]|uniref:stage II sporulation protein M n=1 Tax=Gryllotalpicola ginsengisoli TaxID=444608 RepID=UPI0003B6384E|nr:stage II sporulation protein M [Gryllotalpicola ginsengisoli]
MDLDAFTAAHSGEWERLAWLARKRTLDGREADELIELFQTGSAQLSAMTSAAGPSVPAERLSIALARARLRFTGAADNPMQAIPRFFVLQLPAALYRLRWVTVAVAFATILIAVLFAWWVDASPAVLATLGQSADLKKLVDHDFVDYYSENPAASFTGQVWTNNAWIAAQCIAFGITGAYVPYVVLQNAVNLGVDAAAMFAYGRGDVFFSYVLPHGLLELTSIFVAAAAGLRIFWAWVAPGPRTRGRALAEEGRALFTVAVGLTLSLLVSGIIEGFVTPSPLPVWAKIAIGAVALAAFLFYMLVIGRRAHLAGETGDLQAADRGATQLVAG